MKQNPPPGSSVAEKMARQFFGVTSDPGSLRRAVRSWLIAALCSMVFVPGLFWLRYGEVGPLGLGLTAFAAVYCLLSAVGLYFLRKPQYHTPVALKNDWLDRLGAFWLISCGLGPFLGWMLANGLPLTPVSWRWVYAGRFVLSALLPILTSLALLRYVRGKGAPVMLAILLMVTALPVWSAWSTGLDLWSGPVASRNDAQILVLPNTGRELETPQGRGLTP